jgi:hypothetical protein
MNMEKARKTAKVWLWIAVALMLISMIVVSIVQTGGGNVTIKELFVETDDGIALAANLYIPKAATPRIRRLPLLPVTAYSTIKRCKTLTSLAE